MTWTVEARYGTGRTTRIQRPNRASARTTKRSLERNATLAGVPFDVRIKNS